MGLKVRDDLSLCAGNEEGMVAALAELHHDVEEAGNGRGTRALGQETEVALHDGTIVLLLDGC